MRPIFALAKSLLAVTPERGAGPLVFLATPPEVEGRSGGRSSKRRPAKISRAGLDDAAARRLRDLLAKRTGVDGSSPAIDDVGSTLTKMS